jgi:hypothetical protein
VRLDRAALVHGGVGLGDAIEVRLEVEDATGVDGWTSTRSGRPTTPGSSSSTRGRTDFYGDWERAANDTVAILRSEAGRDPYDRGLSDLVGELSTQSETFRTRWAAHNVRIHQTGVK